MNNFIHKFLILISFLGVAAFGLGVIIAIIQGGWPAICFLVALLLGTLVLGLEGCEYRSTTSMIPHLT